ncbi:hypothetical protein M885DRAFT_564915 [Pelagophyceae sp. CCMP2097]|nr:hypothetical protein M885DRAFT_564915 [Pelagophyceae sp. CCMP2097]
MGFDRHDAWRKHPFISGMSKGWHPFPGLRLAIGIFTAYMIVEYIYNIPREGGAGRFTTAAFPNTEKKPKHKFKYKKKEIGEMPELHTKAKL